MPARRQATKEEKQVSAPQEGEQDREGLLTALGKLRPALRVAGAIPELGHVWFGGGHASAYDGGLGLRIALDLGLECGIPGRPLLALLATSALKQVSITPLEADVAVAVKMGRSRTKLNVLDIGRRPWPFPAEHGATSHLSEEAIEAFRVVLVSKAASPTRLEHHGIYVYSNKGEVDVYATDSRTVAHALFSDPKAKLPKFTFLPRPLVEQIVALCPHGAELTCADDHFAAVGRGVEVCSNVLDTTGLTNLPAIVDKVHQDHPDAVPLPTGLEAALDRAEVLAGGNEAIVDLAVDKKTFRVSGRYALGELGEELTMEESHPSVKLKVDAAVMRRGLLAAPDAFSATARSLAFYGGDNFMYLVSSRD